MFVLSIVAQDEIEPTAPAPREMVELENSLTTVVSPIELFKNFF